MGALAVYILCGLTCVICVVLLYRSYLQTKSTLSYWCALGFAGMAGNNLLLIPDFIIYPDVDFTTFRSFALLIGLMVILGGLIWESV